MNKQTGAAFWGSLFLMLILLVQVGAKDGMGSVTAVADHQAYLPFIARPVAEGALPPPQPHSGTPPLNFPAIRQSLNQQGLELAHNKIGFHTGVGGNTNGLYDWMQALDAARVPIFLKSADNAAPLYAAQQLMQASGVPHILVFRRTGPAYDVPDYALPPQTAAREHWQRHKDAWPPELDPSLVWIETVNEPDKNRAEWLGLFAQETARLALADGYKWAAFGWSSGEPEPYHWESPAMLDFLGMVGRNPSRLAISFHEYSFTIERIGVGYPYLIGRFQALFQVCDRHGIPRPPVFISEWGWEYNHVPEPEIAMSHIEWAAWLYAAYPQVRGVAIWYLGGYFGEIHNETQRLIAPVTDYSLSHYFAFTPGQGTVDPYLFVPPQDR
jgi:hypothetical protein